MRQRGKEKGNQIRESNIPCRRKPLWGRIGFKATPSGGGPRLERVAPSVPHGVGGPHSRSLPTSAPRPSHLPPCLQERVSSSWEARPPHVWPPPVPGPQPAAPAGSFFLHQQSCCFVVAGFFPAFPPGKEQFPNSGMDSEQKVMDSAVTKPPEVLMEERTLLSP